MTDRPTGSERFRQPRPDEAPTVLLPYVLAGTRSAPEPASLQIPLRTDERAGLQRVASWADATPGDVILTAAAIVLSRSTGTGDILVRLTGDDGRSQVLRIRVDQGTASEWIRGLADVRSSGTASPTSTGPRPEITLRLADTALLEGSLVVQARADRADGELLFDRRRLSHDDANRLARQIADALTSIVDAPTLPVRALPFVGREHERQVLQRWNPPMATDASESWVHSFLSVARRTPDAVALSGSEGKRTYRELLVDASVIRSQLERADIGCGDVVALALPPSTAGIAALVGTLLAGAAFVGLYDGDPPERRRSIVVDSGARILLTRSDLDGPLDVGIPTMQLDLLATGVSAETGPTRTDRHDPAYLTYTSGTTGRPKGVVTSVANLASYAAEASTWYAMTPADRVLSFSSLSFDFCVAEIFPILSAGGTLVPRDPRFRSAADEFWEACDSEGVTVLMLPTAFWSELARDLRATPRRLPGSVRLVSIGGERASPDLVRAWNDATGIELVNGYGPTETTVEATRCRLTGWSPGLPPAWRHEVPIGTATGIARTYVVDTWSDGPQLAPIGVPGELWVGGSGVASGYLHRPSETAERFLPDPFVRGERVFRTGDRCRYLPDGAIEFLGRMDRQVQVRGFRVEPDEVEIALSTHPAVRAAAVTTETDVTGNTRLVAHAAVDMRSPDLARELRTAVGALVPEHMVPSRIELWEQLPLRSNGKVDVDALRQPVPPPPSAPEKAAGDDGATSIGTGGDLERLRRMWIVLLGVSSLHDDDDFFELGGQSIQAMRLTGQIRRELRIPATVDALFERPRFGSYAAALGLGDAAAD